MHAAVEVGQGALPYTSLTKQQSDCLAHFRSNVPKIVQTGVGILKTQTFECSVSLDFDSEKLNCWLYR